MRRLRHLLAVLQSAPVANVPDIEVSGFALDNRQIKLGMVFVALQGTQQHGLAYADAAVAAGAVAILYQPMAAAETQTDDGATHNMQQQRQSIVEDGSSPQSPVSEAATGVPMIAIEGLATQLGALAAAFYEHPSHAIEVVGVTGTDGKTSVTHFIAAALQALGQQAGVIGTLGIGRPAALQVATHTTPDAISTQSHLRALSDTGFTSVAMEVSSHALDQGRVVGVNFSIAVLTNLSRDHLDYHITEQAYADAKRKLFYWPNLRAVVLNLDDDFGCKLAAELAVGASSCEVLGYGVGRPADYPAHTVVASAAVFDHTGIRAHISSPWGAGELHAPVLGRFNLDNLLAALGVLLLQGHTLAAALAALAQVQTVPGRMERVNSAQQASDLLTVVDYAHTPGALGSVLSAVRAHTSRELTCVFGCGGDRDAGKRPLMAQAAEQAADRVIVTDDNPRNEDPQGIFADIRRGFARPEQVWFEHDRAQAIRRAIRKAGVGDTVLIAGKGHETVQIVQQEQRPFDDREQARRALQECVA